MTTEVLDRLQDSTVTLSNKYKITNMDNLKDISIQDQGSRARFRVVAGITEQLLYIECDMTGKLYQPTGIKIVTQPDGSRVSETYSKRRTPWYFKHNGIYYTEIRYGSFPIDFSDVTKRKEIDHKPLTAIEAGPELSNLIGVYKEAINVIRLGTHDAELSRLSSYYTDRNKKRR